MWMTVKRCVSVCVLAPSGKGREKRKGVRLTLEGDSLIGNRMNGRG